MDQEVSPTLFLPADMLSRLVTELDDESVTAILLHGSYARGEALPPYSDIDLVRILYETPEREQRKQFFWCNGYLVTLSSRPLSLYQEWLKVPQEAIFRISSIRDAQILLDKHGSFRRFQQEACNWKWEALQEAANAYASQVMLEQTEIVLKLLRAFAIHDAVAASEMMLDLFSSLTDAVAVQRGIVIRSGNTYFHQIQQTIGLNSQWTRYHLRAAGAQTPDAPPPSLEERGMAALHLYRETFWILQDALQAGQKEAIRPLLKMIEDVSAHKNFL